METTAPLSASSTKPRIINVGMGQTAMGDRSTQFTSVLGSCVGVILWHPRVGVAAMAHVVLPQSHGQKGPPGKFADTAIPFLLNELTRLGCPRLGLVAKIAGGANMFGIGGPLQIGDDNIMAVRTLLKQVNIPITAEDVGGTHGRKVTFTCSSGELLIEIAGRMARTI